MSDVLTPKQRSYNMSRIRSKWTEQEKIIHNHLKSRKIRHRMHPNIKGNPDILLKDSKTLIFLDGCFWHRCPRCFSEPASNKKFWLSKIERNVRKDRETNKMLKNNGWNIIRIWEHAVKKDIKKCLKKIESVNSHIKTIK